MQSIRLSPGSLFLYSGVRLLLNELVPAFRGIAMRIVPDAKPALDCPVLFPYAPNAVIVGFLATTVGSIIGMLVFPMFGGDDDSPRAVNQLFRRRYGRGIWQCAGRTSAGR